MQCLGEVTCVGSWGRGLADLGGLTSYPLPCLNKHGGGEAMYASAEFMLWTWGAGDGETLCHTAGCAGSIL